MLTTSPETTSYCKTCKKSRLKKFRLWPGFLISRLWTLPPSLNLNFEDVKYLLEYYAEPVEILTIAVERTALNREYWMIYRGPGFQSRVIWLLPHPLPLLPSVSCLAFSVSLCFGGRAYWQERGGGRRGRSQSVRRRESLVLYKSFNTLCIRLCSVANIPLLYALFWSSKNHSILSMV